MSKLCKLQNKFPSKLGKYAHKIDNPKYMCGKCGRAVNKSKNVCKPLNLNDITNDIKE